jgi:hypothetical protein
MYATLYVWVGGCDPSAFESLSPPLILISIYFNFHLSGKMAPRKRTKTKRPASPPPRTGTSTFTFDVEDLDTAPEAEHLYTYVDRASADGRSYVRETVRVQLPSPMKKARLGEISVGNMSGPSASAPEVTNKPWGEERYTMSNDANDDDPPLPATLPLNPKCFEPAMCFPHFKT